MPGYRASGSRELPFYEALARTILTFRDAAGVRWIRMPDGTFAEQTHYTARQNVLAALEVPLPEPSVKQADQQRADTAEG